VRTIWAGRQRPNKRTIFLFGVPPGARGNETMLRAWGEDTRGAFAFEKPILEKSLSGYEGALSKGGLRRLQQFLSGYPFLFLLSGILAQRIICSGLLFYCGMHWCSLSSVFFGSRLGSGYAWKVPGAGNLMLRTGCSSRQLVATPV
jgi:hypothetical protein